MTKFNAHNYYLYLNLSST